MSKPSKSSTKNNYKNDLIADLKELNSEKIEHLNIKFSDVSVL